MPIELKDLCGKHILSGIEVGEKGFETRWDGIQERSYVKFTLDGIHYLAVEDPNDGYRSYMEELQTTDEPCEIHLPNVEVVCHMMEDGRRLRNDVLVFIDAVNGKEILSIGTENYDDYYPYCVLHYTPENMSCNERRDNMNDLISRSSLLEAFGEAPNAVDPLDRVWLQQFGDWLEYTDKVKAAPTIEAEPVRHGRWVPCGFGKEIMCSVCRCELGDVWEYRHCPNCGAKMQGGSDE